MINYTKDGFSSIRAVNNGAYITVPADDTVEGYKGTDDSYFPSAINIAGAKQSS